MLVLKQNLKKLMDKELYQANIKKLKAAANKTASKKIRHVKN